MNITSFTLALVLNLFLCSYETDKSAVSITKIKLQTPFVMPNITVPDFRKCKTFSIVDFGTVQNDKSRNSAAIAKANSAANEAVGKL